MNDADGDADVSAAAAAAAVAVAVAAETRHSSQSRKLGFVSADAATSLHPWT